MEELICALEMGKPDYDGEDVNYDVATIEDAIAIIKKYAEIKAKVDEYNEKLKKDRPVENHLELMVFLKELEAHQLCLANQILEIFEEKS